MRLLQLDYLRGLAVLLVLGRHFDPLPTDIGWAAGPLEAWERCGWVGVDLFFVLSGFLVSGLIMAEYRSSGQVGVGRFLVRRGFKIYPAFYTLLAVTALLEIARGKTPPGYPFLCEALYLQNYGQAVWQHTWTLAVEEHFYLALGLAAVVVASRPAIRRPWVLIGGCLVGMVGALAARVYSWWWLGIHDPGWYGTTHLRFDAFLAGVLLSFFYHYRRDAVARCVEGRQGRMALAGLALVFPCLFFDVSHPAMLTAGYTVLYLGFALILLAAIGGTPVHRTASRLGLLLAPLAFVGFYSYSIYLWHIPIRRWLPPAFDRLGGGPLPGPLELALYLAGSVAVGFLMAKLVELPFLRIRDRYFPSMVSRRRAIGSEAPAAPTNAVAAEALPECQATGSLPDVVVSLINHSNPDLLVECLRSLYAATRFVSLEVWVVDNATDGRGVAAMRAEFPQIHWLMNDRRLGFSANHNQVLASARGRYFCVLNDDTVIHDRALDRLVAYMDARPDVGVTGPRLLNPDGSIQLSTFRFPDAATELAGICYLPRRLHFLKDRGFDPAHLHEEPAEVDWVLGACLMIRDKALRAVGLLDSVLSPLANTEEVDWCRRARKTGWKVEFCPTASIMHYGGQSLRSSNRRGIDRIRVEMMRTRLAYFAKHDGRRTATAAATAYVLTLPWNFLVLVRSWARGRTPRDRAWDELTTLAAIARTGAVFARDLYRRPKRVR